MFYSDTVQWLMKNRIPSISPNVGIFLDHILKSMEEHKDMPPDVKEYYKALVLVCNVAMFHQGAVLQKLKDLIDKQKAGSGEEHA